MPNGLAVDKVDLSGNLTVRRATEIQSLLLSEIRERRNINLDCTQASDVDLTFVQLLLAARKSADDSGVRLSLTHLDGGVLQTALRRAGVLGPSAQTSESDRVFWSTQTMEPADGQDHPHRR